MMFRMKVLCRSGFFGAVRNVVYSEFWDLKEVPPEFLQDYQFPSFLIMFGGEKLNTRGLLKNVNSEVWMYDFNKNLKLMSRDVIEVSIEDETGRALVLVSS